MKAILAVLMLIVAAGCATQPSDEEYNRGYQEAVTVIDKEMFSPIGISGALATKQACERKYKVVCGIYGGYAPMDDKPSGPPL